ncbi:MAG: DNA-binding protein [Brasilonema angustatum HA4187-MV1]|jgi:hypothetical protein|nr:DNA-binding protein [Brasilonema angustatum HA4187-MV1]
MTVQDKNQRVKISLDLSPELYETLKNVAQQLDGDMAEVLLKGIVLMLIAVEAKQNRKHLWITDENQTPETEIVGI